MNVSTLTQKIIQSSAPVMFLDTCIFLDILRAPYRAKLSTGQSSTIRNLIEASRDQTRMVWLVTCDTVSHELDQNIGVVLTELKQQEKRLGRERLQYIEVVKDTIQSQVSYGHEESDIDLTTQLSSLVGSFRGACEVIAAEDQHSVGAMARVVQSSPPSSKGKNEAKDCQIFEIFLDLAKQLQSNNFADPICLVTSNTSDFGTISKPTIQVDLEQVGAAFATDLLYAKFICGIRP